MTTPTQMMDDMAAYSQTHRAEVMRCESEIGESFYMGRPVRHWYDSVIEAGIEMQKTWAILHANRNYNEPGVHLSEAVANAIRHKNLKGQE